MTLTARLANSAVNQLLEAFGGNSLLWPVCKVSVLAGMVSGQLSGTGPHAVHALLLRFKEGFTQRVVER